MVASDRRPGADRGDARAGRVIAPPSIEELETTRLSIPARIAVSADSFDELTSLRVVSVSSASFSGASSRFKRFRPYTLDFDVYDGKKVKLVFQYPSFSIRESDKRPVSSFPIPDRNSERVHQVEFGRHEDARFREQATSGISADLLVRITIIADASTLHKSFITVLRCYAEFESGSVVDVSIDGTDSAPAARTNLTELLYPIDGELWVVNDAATPIGVDETLQYFKPK